MANVTRDMSLLELLRDLERYGFESTGGSIQNCSPFIELKRRIIDANPDELVEDGWMETLRGNKLWFANPGPDDLDIYDIAECLAKRCRYNGHCSGFYSVAEHSCHIFDYILKVTRSVKLALTGLLHDAAEPYVGDAIRPLKRKLINFGEIERKFDAAVALKWGLQYPWHPLIKELDSRILVDERKALMKPGIARGNAWATDDLEPLGCVIQGWDWKRARWEFLDRYHACIAANNNGHDQMVYESRIWPASLYAGR